MEPIKMTHMPALICGRGAVKFAATLGRKRAAVIGYTDSVEEKAREIFAGTDTEIRYIASIQREPLIGDIFDNLPALQEFQPDLILAIGGGSVMDVAKGLHLFYENPHLSFADSLKPFALPALGKKAVSVHVPTTSGTGSETSSAAVFIHPETKVKNLLLSNTLIPQYAVVDAEFTDHLPPAIQIVSGLDAMCHAIESTTAANSNVCTKAIATQAALDVLDYLPDAVNMDLPEAQRLAAKEKLHMAATMAGIAITNSFTGIVHSYDHPGPAFHLPHGVVCGIMLPYAMELVGPQEEYACLARRLGYRGDRPRHRGTLKAEAGIPARPGAGRNRWRAVGPRGNRARFGRSGPHGRRAGWRWRRGRSGKRCRCRRAGFPPPFPRRRGQRSG